MDMLPWAETTGLAGQYGRRRWVRGAIAKQIDALLCDRALSCTMIVGLPLSAEMTLGRLPSVG
jgi:hypothetical protein